LALPASAHSNGSYTHAHYRRLAQRAYARWHVRAYRHGTHAPIWRRADNESGLRRISDRLGLRSLLALRDLLAEPAARAAADRPRRLRFELADLPSTALAAGSALGKPSHAGGKQHSRHLRPAVYRAGHSAGEVRRRLLQLFVPG